MFLEPQRGAINNPAWSFFLHVGGAEPLKTRISYGSGHKGAKSKPKVAKELPSTFIRAPKGCQKQPWLVTFLPCWWPRTFKNKHSVRERCQNQENATLLGLLFENLCHFSWRSLQN